MDENILNDILSAEEQAAWQKIQSKLTEHISDIYLSNLKQLDESIPSGTKYLDHPLQPKHISNEPREIIIRLHAEISTIDNNHQLQDISELFNHYYHIPVPANSDFRDNLIPFLEKVDDQVSEYANKIKPNNL
jgi:hypothetical protein